MTFRGSMPSGQAFNGQQPMPYPPYPPQYGSGTSQANALYQNQQFVPAHPQQPAQYYQLGAPQLQSYDGAHDRPPPPSAASPVQYVDPSYLQQPVTVHPMENYLPAPAPPPQPAAHVRYPQPIQQPLSANNSPRMSMIRPPSQGSHRKSTPSAGPTRSSSSAGVTKSPLVSHASIQVETLPLLLCVAEDCFSKARASVTEVGRSADAHVANEYHKLIATGLGCLEVAMQSNKLRPRLEARLRLRYAGILVEETVNTMEAETALTKGIALCEKVFITLCRI